MMRRMSKLALAVVGVSLASVIASTDVKAEILASTARVASVYNQGFVPVTEAGNTSLLFSTSVLKQKVLVTYTATCETNYYSSLSLQIYVDGQVTNPKGSAILCGSDYYPVTVSASRSAVYIVANKGTHSVIINLTGSGTLSNASLTVQR
jgi:hypothetical protein